MAYKGIRFVYDEPALIVKAGSSEYLVVADLHIGMELGISKHRGVHLFNATEHMAERIAHMMEEFSLDNLIILGDVKESILYPEHAEISLLKDFFLRLKDFNIKIVAGNHDAHLADIIGREVSRNLAIDGFGFVHGNRRPDEKLMALDYLISAHDHIAIRMVDGSGTVYEQKAWAFYRLNESVAERNYGRFNKGIRLVSMPAFNELIMGSMIERSPKGRLNPLLSNNIFDYKSIETYNLMGQRVHIE